MALRLRLLLTTTLVACAPADAGDPVTAIYVVPDDLAELAAERFLDHPLPSDVRRDPGGALRFSGLYDPRGLPLLGDYVAATEGLLDGFSPAAAGHLRFDGRIDLDSLPRDPVAATDPRSSVQLIDVDPDSPERGRRQLVTVSFRSAGGVYVLPNTLRWMPAPGFPLRPRTRYALVVTHTLRAATGGPAQPSAELEEVLGLAEPTGPRIALRRALAPTVELLAGLGIRTRSIAHLAVFTTSDPTGELLAFAEHLRAAVPAPVVRKDPPIVKVHHQDAVEYQGWYYPSPNYQQGKLPFENAGEGGDFYLEHGAPAVVDFFDLRFSVMVPAYPSCKMPPEGWPIVLYAHGTGGDWQSYIEDGTAKTLAERCLASMGVDQIFHGARPGAPTGPDADLKTALLFFNINNLRAARTNVRQSALDEVQRVRLITEGGLVVPASVSHTTKEIRFDPSRILFFGHSQGGLNGQLLLAIEPAVRGGVLSGAGGVFGITLLDKTEPAPSVAEFVRTLLLGLDPEEYGELDLFHPAVSLGQTVVDPVDPVHYARLIVREPPAGNAPKSVYMTEGIGPDGVGDSYTPPRGTEATAVAMGLPPQLPLTRPFAELSWAGLAPVEVPAEGLRGNLGAGKASGVLAQWTPPPDRDGHFVVFSVPAARAQAADFLRLLADDPVGTVPPPGSP